MSSPRAARWKLTQRWWTSSPVESSRSAALATESGGGSTLRASAPVEDETCQAATSSIGTTQGKSRSRARLGGRGAGLGAGAGGASSLARGRGGSVSSASTDDYV